MSNLKIKVTEYGVKKGKIVLPSHYTWDYCIQNRIPYIIVHPKIKYSKIEYDLFTIDDGLTFSGGFSFGDHWMNIYKKYLEKPTFPKNEMSLIGGNRSALFNILKEDQESMLILLFHEIEDCVRKNGIIDKKQKEYFADIKKHNEINERREKYLEQLGKGN